MVLYSLGIVLSRNDCYWNNEFSWNWFFRVVWSVKLGSLPTFFFCNYYLGWWFCVVLFRWIVFVCLGFTMEVVMISAAYVRPESRVATVFGIPRSRSSVRSSELNAKVVSWWDSPHGFYPGCIHDYVVDGWVIDDWKVDNFVTPLAKTGNLTDPRVIDVVPEKPVSGFGVGTTFG